MRFCRLIAALFLTSAYLGIGPGARSADWPMWRYDAGRTAASPAALPGTLHRAWSVAYGPRSPVWDDPLNRDLMPYDSDFEPVVSGTTLVVGFNDSDKIVALDTRSGRERWRFYADGPVRLPAVAALGKVWFAGDDGCLYCLRLDDGTLAWKFRGGPSERRILGNERLISVWPARGGPVLWERTIYFAASIWPFMGTFLYAIDAETGRVEWVNDGTSALFINQPHNYPAFAGVAPQGALAATADALLVPGGRSVPACFDRRTGALRYFHLAAFGKSGGSSVYADEGSFFGHERVGRFSRFDLAGGMRAEGTTIESPVLSHGAYYAGGATVSERARGQLSRSVWEVPVDASRDMIRAGDRLYACGRDAIAAVAIPAAGGRPLVAWTEKIEGDPRRLIAADDRLFVVTRAGRIVAYSGEERAAARAVDDGRPPAAVGAVGAGSLDPVSAGAARAILQRTGVRDGYAVVYAPANADFLDALTSESRLRLIAIEPNAGAIATMRRRLDERGLYGRVAVHPGAPADFSLPPYLSSLTIVGRAALADLARPEAMRALFASLRPYGGVAWFDVDTADRTTVDSLRQAAEQARLEGAAISHADGRLLLTRQGALPGAGVWTHQYGDIANTIKSNDRLVKLPLGLLWFGGSSNVDVLPRHGHGPPEQVTGGRLFIPGADCLSARDVYTGRVIWKVKLERPKTFGVYWDETYHEKPLSTEYNQVHIPGANARGTNFVATPDRVYVIDGRACRMLDSATGESLGRILLPAATTGELPADSSAAPSPQSPSRSSSVAPPEWGYIGVSGDILLAGRDFAHYSRRLRLPAERRDSRSKWRFTDYDRSASAGLVALDRHTGRVRWTLDAKHGFLHNAICVGNGTLYCIDKVPPNLEQKLARRGIAPAESFRLLAVDLAGGRKKWETSSDVFGTWLSISEAHNVLLQSTRPSNDTVRSEDGARMIAYRADAGDVLWDRPIGYSTPPILHGDRIIAGGRMYELKTGARVRRVDPLTGAATDWSYVSTKGCNYPIACENLMTFRSSAAAFFDLARDGGTGHFGGFKSGCTSNLVAADGVLNAPDYTRTCSCSFQNQTSLALVHMPDLEIWTHNDLQRISSQRVRQIGINLAAPGDRRAADGTLWLEYPSVGGPSPNVDVAIAGHPRWFRHHASRIAGEGPSWVAASGAEGIERLTLRLLPTGRQLLAEGISVGRSENDAVEAKDGRVDLAAASLELGRTTAGLRFGPLPIKPGDRVREAYLQFAAAEKTSQPATFELRGEATDDAPLFVDRPRDLAGRRKTKAHVDWNVPFWPKRGAAGDAQRSPDLAPILRKIVERPGWKPGNSIALFISGKGKRHVAGFDGDPSMAARLLVKLDSKADDPTENADAVAYTVRLTFVEPDNSTIPGQRVFNVSLQGRLVLKDFDVLKEAGAPLHAVTREFRGIRVAHALEIALEASASRPTVLCGVEAIAE